MRSKNVRELELSSDYLETSQFFNFSYFILLYCTCYVVLCCTCPLLCYYLHAIQMMQISFFVFSSCDDNKLKTYFFFFYYLKSIWKKESWSDSYNKVRLLTLFWRKSAQLWEALIIWIMSISMHICISINANDIYGTVAYMQMIFMTLLHI